jgi:hypothetical protein
MQSVDDGASRGGRITKLARRLIIKATAAATPALVSKAEHTKECAQCTAAGLDTALAAAAEEEVDMRGQESRAQHAGGNDEGIFACRMGPTRAAALRQRQG